MSRGKRVSWCLSMLDKNNILFKLIIFFFRELSAKKVKEMGIFALEGFKDPYLER